MRKEYKHPAPYSPDFNYLEGVHAAERHIRDITKTKPHPGQAQHLGGMSSYHKHMKELHYGPGESIKKDLKRVLDYLFYYSKTDHDIYHFLAEDALMHMDQMVSDIQDPKEKEHIRYFVECVREYMHWLKVNRSKNQNMTKAHGYENREMNKDRQDDDWDMDSMYDRQNQRNNAIGFTDEYDRKRQGMNNRQNQGANSIGFNDEYDRKRQNTSGIYNPDFNHPFPPNYGENRDNRNITRPYDRGNQNVNDPNYNENRDMNKIYDRGNQNVNDPNYNRGAQNVNDPNYNENRDKTNQTGAINL